jgi:VIT1/CCC1 family predicted Fe2+/Mn2+ transporter
VNALLEGREREKHESEVQNLKDLIEERGLEVKEARATARKEKTRRKEVENVMREMTKERELDSKRRASIEGKGENSSGGEKSPLKIKEKNRRKKLERDREEGGVINFYILCLLFLSLLPSLSSLLSPLFPLTPLFSTLLSLLSLRWSWSAIEKRE